MGASGPRFLLVNENTIDVRAYGAMKVITEVLQSTVRRAPQHRAHTRRQLTRAERLRHVVVGADAEAEQLVDLVVRASSR
jgi:hypothetical protein